MVFRRLCVVYSRKASSCLPIVGLLMPKRADLIKAVQALSHRRTTGVEAMDTLAELNSGSDRTVAIIWGTTIDDRLRSLIEAQSTHMTGDEHAGLFPERGALSDFASKINVAYLMDLFGKTTKQDLQAI